MDHTITPRKVGWRAAGTYEPQLVRLYKHTIALRTMVVLTYPFHEAAEGEATTQIRRKR